MQLLMKWATPLFECFGKRHRQSGSDVAHETEGFLEGHPVQKRGNLKGHLATVRKY